jgi:hypothetical protein
MSDTKQVFVSDVAPPTRGRKKTARQKSVPANFISEIKSREKSKSKRLMKLIGGNDHRDDRDDDDDHGDDYDDRGDDYDNRGGDRSGDDRHRPTPYSNSTIDFDNEEFKDDFDGGFGIIPRNHPPDPKPTPRSILKGGPNYVPKTRKQVYVAPPSVISGGNATYGASPTITPEEEKKKKLQEMAKLEKFIARRALSKMGTVFSGTRKKIHRLGKSGNSIRMFVFTKKQHREKVDKLKKDIQEMNPEKIKEELRRKKLISNPATPDCIAKDIYENLLLLNANVKITKE